MIAFSNSPLDTAAIAGRLARKLRSGDLVALTGELGAGKTEFARGIVAAMGRESEVSSPSFVRVHSYGGSPLLIHADFYLAKSEADALDYGLDEYLTSGAIVMVEWADRFPYLITPGAWWVEIKMGSDECSREISIRRESSA